MLNILRAMVGLKPQPKVIAGEVPNHINEIGKLYPVISTLVSNKATGEIKRFELTDNNLRVGQAMFLNKDKEIWVHLGNDYFKNTVTI